MSPRYDTPDIEQLLRDATHAYVDTIEPAPDSWAQLRGRADDLDTPRTHSRRRWGLGGFAAAAAAVAVVIAVVTGGNGGLDEGLTTTTDPAGDPELVARFPEGDAPDVLATGTAQFARAGGVYQWQGTIDVTIADGDLATGPISFKVGMASTPGPGAGYHYVDVCSASPDADGVVTCTATFDGAPNDRHVAFGPGAHVSLNASVGGASVEIAYAVVEEIVPSTTGTTSIPAAVHVPEGVTVVATFGDVLGWWDGTNWISDNDQAPPIVGGEQYHIVLVGQPPTVGTGSALGPGCYNDERALGIEVTNFERGDMFPAPVPVFVTGVENAQPHAVELLSGDTYLGAAQEILDGVGATAAVRLVQVVRTDFEGDGSDEIVVVAQADDPANAASTFGGEAGEGAVVFVRRVVDGEVRTQVLADDFIEVDDLDQQDGPYPHRALYNVDAVADLNGDGVMELVMTDNYYEGGVTSVFELAGDELVEVLSAPCGS